MNENKAENISSLIDGNQAPDETFEQLLIDDEHQERWHNYHLIGDIIRNEVTEPLSLDLADSVAQALADEPTVLAPVKKTSLTDAVKNKVIQFAKPFGQVAIAASAAGLMVLGVQQNVAQNDVVVPSQIVQTNPLAGIAAPVSYSYNTNGQQQENQKQAIVEQHRRFQALLTDHKQQVKLHAVAQPTPAHDSMQSEAIKP